MRRKREEGLGKEKRGRDRVGHPSFVSRSQFVRNTHVHHYSTATVFE